MAEQPPEPVQNFGRTFALGVVAGQAGCVIPVLIGLGLALGIGLDNWLGTGALFTIGLTLLSIPLSLFAAVRAVLSGVRAFDGDEQPTGGDF